MNYLWFDQHQIDEEDDIVMLDVFVGETLAARALGQADALAERVIVGLAVGGVKVGDGIGAFDADRHGVRSWRTSFQGSCRVDLIVAELSWSSFWKAGVLFWFSVLRDIIARHV